MSPWLKNTGYVLTCLTIPVAWGWLVNWAFSHWSARRNGKEEEPAFIDYYI